MIIYKFIAYLHQGENVMALNVNVNSDFSMQEVSDEIRSALALDERLAKHKKARYYDLCKDFETKYKMSSDIFMQKFESGHLDDLDDYFDWYAAKKGLNHWNKSYPCVSV